MRKFIKTLGIFIRLKAMEIKNMTWESAHDPNGALHIMFFIIIFIMSASFLSLILGLTVFIPWVQPAAEYLMKTSANMHPISGGISLLDIMGFGFILCVFLVMMFLAGILIYLIYHQVIRFIGWIRDNWKEAKRLASLKPKRRKR